ncbi:hypothetical protein FDECE_6481 [Fusarium decemcellulare]|nr:hypothetical protein FDECE_6481 [Fusarium decemcellulare]
MNTHGSVANDGHNGSSSENIAIRKEPNITATADADVASNTRLRDDPEARAAFLSTFSPEEAKAIMKKVDRRFFILIGFMFMVKNIDNANASLVKVLQVGKPSNIITELGMTLNSYNWVGSIYGISYIIFELPSNMVQKYFTPHTWQSRIFLSWGIATACSGAVKTGGQLLTCRFLVGLFEAGMFPGVVTTLTYWYRTDEFGRPMMWFFGISNLSGIIGSLLCYGISYMDGAQGLSAWRWVYIIEGVLTILFAGIIFFVMPDFPKSPRSGSWLTEREREFIEARLPLNTPTTGDKNFDRKEVWHAFSSPVVWSFLLCQTFMNLSLYGFNWYLPTIITNFGFVGLPANQLLNIPPVIAGCLGIIFSAWFVGRGFFWRPLYVLILVGLSLVSYILLMTLNDKGKYAACILGSLFTISFYPPYWSWRAGYLTGSSGAAFAMGLQSSIAQLGAVVGPQYFQSRWAYNGYRNSFAICLSMIKDINPPDFIKPGSSRYILTQTTHNIQIMTESKKQLHLAAFIYSGAASQAWRHPDINAHQSLDVNYFIEYAQLAEQAKFDTLFLADGSGLQIQDVVKHYWSVSAFEPATLFAAIAVRTKHIGLVYTASVSDNEPNALARQLASLDHISHGRAGWNIVTTQGPGARNLNVPPEETKDSAAKYKRAREFYHVVGRLWDSFEDDALLRDKESGIYVDLSKVHAPQLNSDVSLYKAPLPLRIERPIQGHPVIAQAGTSPEGMAFGGSVADLIYCANYSIEDGQKTYRKLKEHAVAAGRKPEHLIVLTGVAVVWGKTHEEAERKLRQVSALWPIEVAVQNLGINFEGVDLDTPFPETYTLSFGSSGRAAAIASFARSNKLTIRQTAERCSVGLGHRPLVGTTQSIADDLQSWLEAGATDGFAVIQPLLINGLQDFTAHVIPELQRRGLWRRDYEGSTLRENLGVPRPDNFYTGKSEAGSYTT